MTMNDIRYIIKGGRFQREFNIHRQKMMDGLDKDLAKQRAFNMLFKIMESKVVFRSSSMRRVSDNGDIYMPKDWLDMFSYLKEYGLKDLGNVYIGIINEQEVGEWLTVMAKILDVFLIDGDVRVIEIINKKTNAFRIVTKKHQRVNQGRIV